MIGFREPTRYEDELIDDIIDYWHDHFPRYTAPDLSEFLLMTQEEYSIFVTYCIVPENWSVEKVIETLPEDWI